MSKEKVKFEFFKFLSAKSSNFWGLLNFGLHHTKWVTSQKYKHLMKDVLSINKILCIGWVLDERHMFFHFQKFAQSFHVGPKFGFKLGSCLLCEVPSGRSTMW